MEAQMHYFFLEGEALTGGLEIALAGKDLNHAKRVLRLKAGDEIAVADGLGQAWCGRITFSSSKKVMVYLDRELPAAESPLNITLFQSLVKGDKMDLIVRQAVELGVSRLVPVVTGRSIPQRAGQQDEKRVLRWRSIIRSAAAQCRRAFLTQIEPVSELKSVLPRFGSCMTLVPWESERTVPLRQLLKQPCPNDRAVFLLIGPEGGFDRAEIEALINSGAVTVHLGPRILRSETAATAVITMVQGIWGDLSGEGKCN